MHLGLALSIVLVVAPFGPAAAESPTGSEDRTVIQVGKKHKSTKGWSRAKYGGPGARRDPGLVEDESGYDGPVDAQDDNCRDAPGSQEYFWMVFGNDRLRDGSDVVWDDGGGRVQLAYSEGQIGRTYGFLYYPDANYSPYQFPYRIISPDNPEDYADATVTITFGQEERTC